MTENSTSEELSSLMKICRRAADTIVHHREVVVASHVDADGLTSAGIACTALERAGIEYKPLFFRQLDPAALDLITDLGPDLVIFTDLGSGMQDEICQRCLNVVVADHHRPSGSGVEHHINPHLVGLDGATHLSGSGASFLLARALASSSGKDHQNDDLASLAIVGAVGDLQDMAQGQLVGLNRNLLEMGSKASVLSFIRDLKLFGKQTRPVFKMLEFSQDPYIPGLSGDEDACIAFLKNLGIRLGGRDGGGGSTCLRRRRPR